MAQTGSITLSNSSSQLQIGQPSFLANTYTISGGVPAQGTTLNLYDPGVASTNFQLGSKKIVAVSATGTTLTSSQSGSTISITNAGSAYSINLPTTLIAGLTYEFIVASAPNAAVTIAAGSAIIVGSCVSSDGSAVSSGNITSGVSNVILGTTAKAGDRYLFTAVNASNWMVFGVTNTHGSVTFS